jgi:single-stranded-DNA-specific exonuclease
VTVDVGVTNANEALAAKTLGLELIITDHHELVDAVPEAILVNPKTPGCRYPWRELAGSGVVLKLVTALFEKLVGLSVEELNTLKPHYWIFAALGTISDRCPLVDENRLIVSEGMSKLRLGIWPSLNVWLEEMGFDLESLSVFDLYSRGIAPFYATDSEEGVRLLLSSDLEWLHNRYSELKERASEWQRGKQKMVEEAERAARQIGGVIVAISDKIGSDYLGTTAHALRERYNLPALALVKRKGDSWHAECRGLDKTDLLNYLAGFKDMFVTFGGHKKACGFTLKPGRLDDFLEALEKNPLEPPENGIDEEEMVFELGIKEDLSDWVLLAPFGEGNPSPRLLAKGVILEESHDGYRADGIPVYIPLSLRPLPQRKGVYDVEYTVNTDGKIRLLHLESSL